MNTLSFRQPILNNSVLTHKGAMPSKTGSADSDASFAMARSIFSSVNFAQTPPLKKKLLQSRDAWSVLERRKNGSVGQSVNTAGNAISVATKHDNSAADALRRVRGGGAVVPPKAAANNRTQVGLPAHPINRAPVRSMNQRWMVAYMGKS